ncbi:MAG TPA: sulfurtransferase, partial [Alcaligenaceae bacterium]|nr:sulfurtransferase [Alcaligenaceae bacterium]
AQLFDLRPSMKYREGHIDGARWSIRNRLIDDIADNKSTPIILIVDDEAIAQAACLDLHDHGMSDITINMDTPAQWMASGLNVVATPENPANHECVDYLFFVHDRHDGNKAAARQYLAWEMNLLAQIDEQEKNSFRLPH